MTKAANKEWGNQIKTAENNLYAFNYTCPDGQKAYYFILVEPLKENAFLKALKGKKELDFRDYGKIIESGYGTMP